MSQLSRAVLFTAVSLTASIAAYAVTAKDVSCVAARGRNPIKIESRCMFMQYGGATRTYRVYKPRTIAKPSAPLLLVLHGGGGSGGATEALTLGQFNRIAERHGLIIVYPEGLGGNWHDGRPEQRTKAVKEGTDDVGYLRALVERINEQYPIDRKRVYATGIANGGLMSYRLACDAADFVAAVAPVAANLPVELAAECRPSRAVPIAIFNGTDDPMMPWIGGEIKVLSSRRGAVLSAQETFERFIKLGDCALPITHAPRNNIADDGTSMVRHVARECENGAEVRLYEILGGGHTWPGGYQYLGQRSVGKVSRELNASDEIWTFVSRFALPSAATNAR